MSHHTVTVTPSYAHNVYPNHLNKGIKISIEDFGSKHPRSKDKNPKWIQMALKIDKIG